MPLPSVEARKILAPSAQFRREALRSILAIFAFLLVYLLMFALSLVLLGASLYGGLMLIAGHPSFYTILFGGGIVACGVMVFVFLVKFLFASAEVDASDLVEISASEEPELFSVIYALAAETATRRPKKIFLCPDVNAAVFYHSSFLSLFLPVRKNLKIGLGLVNVLNAGELKAVIAHEFGHFSQRSMKVGSWVYQVNKIIHDMLFNNRGYADSLRAIARLHSVLGLSVQLTAGIIRAVQWVLQQMYRLVNKTYRGLSRQMEFHADLVAATACGSNNIISALRRSEAGEAAFAATLELCNLAWKDKKVVRNFYNGQRFALQQQAGRQGLALQDGLPDPDLLRGSNGRVNFKDQWASHPTLQEREDYLQPFGLEAPPEPRPAWSLFAQAGHWREMLTHTIYRTVPAAEAVAVLNDAASDQLFAGHVHERSLPAVFGEFYNGRPVTSFVPEEVAARPFAIIAFDSFFTAEKAAWPRQLQQVDEGLAILAAIEKKEIATRSFDFDGKKYKAAEATTVRQQLEPEKAALEEAIRALDADLFRYFYAIAPLAEAEVLKGRWTDYFRLRTKAGDFLALANAALGRLGPLFEGAELTKDEAENLAAALKRDDLPPFKAALADWLQDGAFSRSPELQVQAEKFLQSRPLYFSASGFIEPEIMELNGLARAAWEAVDEFLFLRFRSLLEIQAGLLEKATVATAGL